MLGTLWQYSYKVSQLSPFKCLLQDLSKTLLHTIPSSNYSNYPLVVRYGLQENHPFRFMSFALKPPCLIGIPSQPCLMRPKRSWYPAAAQRPNSNTCLGLPVVRVLLCIHCEPHCHTSVFTDLDLKSGTPNRLTDYCRQECCQYMIYNFQVWSL